MYLQIADCLLISSFRIVFIFTTQVTNALLGYIYLYYFFLRELKVLCNPNFANGGFEMFIYEL